MLINGTVVGYGYSSDINGEGVGGVYYKTDSATNETIGSIGAVREDIAVATLVPNSLSWFIRKAIATSGVYDSAEYVWRHDAYGGMVPNDQKNCTAGVSPELLEPYNATITVYKCPGAEAPTPSSGAVTKLSSALAAVAGAVTMALTF